MTTMIITMMMMVTTTTRLAEIQRLKTSPQLLKVFKTHKFMMLTMTTTTTNDNARVESKLVTDTVNLDFFLKQFWER